MHHYEFTNTWFELTCRGNWDLLLPQLAPSRILEVGSFEGASACHLIDTLGKKHALELHCVDTWQGGVEHQEGGAAQANMTDVEKRFLSNIAQARQSAPVAVDLHIHKELSHQCMARLLAQGKENYFDFIYIDGSHQAPDVLCDAVLAFKLLRVGGVLGFDDYLWTEEPSAPSVPLRCPKPAIDAFEHIYADQIAARDLPLSSYQRYLTKCAG